MTQITVTPTILRVVIDYWDDSVMPYEASRVNNGDGTTFHTEWYSHVPDRPAITFTGESGSVRGGGETGITGSGVGGSAVQSWSVSLDANCVAGQRSDLSSAGPGGGSVSPKVVRSAMFTQLTDALRGVYDVDGIESIAVISYTNRQDDAEGDYIFRTLARVRVTFTSPSFGERSLL